jgi:hypothetical protein
MATLSGLGLRPASLRNLPADAVEFVVIHEMDYDLAFTFCRLANLHFATQRRFEFLLQGRNLLAAGSLRRRPDFAVRTHDGQWLFFTGPILR